MPYIISALFILSPECNYLCEGGYVIGGMHLSASLIVCKITHKMMDRFDELQEMSIMAQGRDN